jgi:magnesium-transporting ATPase (P-type)
VPDPDRTAGLTGMLPDETALAGIGRLVAQAQASRSRAQVLADRAAALLFWVAVGTAVVTVVTWTLLGRPADAGILAVTVLIIACPHALGLAIALVTAIATSLAARSGILVTDRLALERMRKVDAVLFDKTGTLTRGQHRVIGVAAAGGDAGWGQVSAQRQSATGKPGDRLGREHPPGDGYPGARNSSIAATATTSRATAASLGSTVTKASACRRVTARYSASLSVSQSC